MQTKPKKINTSIFFDSRGSFRELFKQKNFKNKFIFDCFSTSKKNVFRGLHAQIKKPQNKIISVISGSIIDYCVDIRQNSKFFGKIYKFKIHEKSKFSLFIPAGFAHGFLCLTKNCKILYKCDNYRSKNSEISINYRYLKINRKKLILSQRDQKAMTFEMFAKIY
jgi:dTDP-4-dehydrorhamnose 3,5-epimerase